MKRPDIINDLLTRMDRGDWQRGDLLPSLRVLAETYDTNPQTVSNALTALALLGRVHTTPRGSKVIVGRRNELHLGCYKALTPGQTPTGRKDWEAKEGEGATEGPTRVETLSATPWIGSLLGIKAGQKVVVRHRTRTLSANPVQYKRTILPKRYAELKPPTGGKPPMLSDGDIPVPKGKTIAQWLGMGVVNIEYKWSMTQADSEESKALCLRNDVPILRIASTGRRADGSIAFVTVTTTPANTETVMCIETPEN